MTSSECFIKLTVKVIFSETSNTSNAISFISEYFIRISSNVIFLTGSLCHQKFRGHPKPSDDENSMPALPNTSRAVFLNESFEAREEDENAKPLCRPVEKGQVQTRNRQIRQWYTQEQQWYATERKKVPYEIPVENVKTEKRIKRRHQSEEAEEPTIPSEDENHSIQGSDSEWAEPGNRPAQPANQRRPYRHVPSPTYYSRRRKKKRRRNESSAAESTTSALDESSERGELPEESDLDSEKDSESESDSDQSDNSESNEESGKKLKLFSTEELTAINSRFQNFYFQKRSKARAQKNQDQAGYVHNRSTNRQRQKRQKRVLASRQENDRLEKFSRPIQNPR